MQNVWVESFKINNHLLINNISNNLLVFALNLHVVSKSPAEISTPIGTVL